MLLSIRLLLNLDVGFELDVGLLAIAMTYAIQLSGLLQYMVRVYAKVEETMTSCERIMAYAALPPEQGPDAAAGLEATALTVAAVEMRPDKISRRRLGELVVRNLSVRCVKGFWGSL